jgi:hypothetical protein
MKKIIFAVSIFLGVISASKAQSIKQTQTQTATKTVVKQKPVTKVDSKKALEKANVVADKKGTQTKIEPTQKKQEINKAIPAKSTSSNVVLKKDGTPDKRYKQAEHLKKDGTPDKRYKKK